VLPVEAFIEGIPEPNGDALPPHSKTSDYMQERQNAYLRKIRNIKRILTIHFIDCNDKRLPKYETLFKNLWRLFLQSRKNNTNIEQSVDIHEIIRRVFIDMQADEFDDYTKTFVAAYYAFILNDEPQSDGTIPFIFLRRLLQQCDAKDTGVDDAMRCISQYQKEVDLSYKCDTTAMNQNEPNIDHILRCVRMLSLFDSLLKFCSLKYTSLKELTKIWKDTLKAYHEYITDPLDLNFYDFFSDFSGHDMIEKVGITVDAQFVQKLLESQTFPQAVQSIVLPLLSARKSKLTLEVHYDLSNACALQQNWEALNKVLTQLQTAGGQAQDEGRRMLQERVKEYESKLHPLVTKICEQYIQMQNLQVLSEQLDRLLKSNTHAASSEALPLVLEKIKKRISAFTSRHKTQSTKHKTDKTKKSVHETMRQEADNELEKSRLLARLRTFCTVTLDEKSIGALETLWHEIKQVFDKLNLLQGLVGMAFHEKNADIPVSADQVFDFITSLTFADAVGHIGLVKLVEARIRQPTQRQSAQLAQAVRCTRYLHEQHTSERELLAAQVATESESFTAIQNAVREQEARLNRALGQLYEDRQVLPRLLEELESLLQTHARAAVQGERGATPAIRGG
jgi:hypothetical protein